MKIPVAGPAEDGVCKYVAQSRSSPMGPFKEFGPTRHRSLLGKCSHRDCRNHKNTLLVAGARLSSDRRPTNTEVRHLAKVQPRGAPARKEPILEAW